jgi:two-component system response regulator FixJ
MSHTGGGIVAIVDDDLAVLESLRFLLEVMGYNVVTYASAPAFLEDQTREIAPACMIVDHHMPFMTGLELAERLRADGILTPLMLITGALSPAISARAAQLGIKDVLEKPPREDELSRFISMYL